MTGACRREELYYITINDIEDKETLVVVKIPKTKTYIERSFVIKGEMYAIYKKYSVLRPVDAPSPKFFLNYQNGKCTRQVIGINKFGGMPKQIASFLKLPNPESFTGHCFRRSSATLLVDGGGDITTLKRHGGWKSHQVAESYIADSIENKTKICEKITESIKVHTASSSATTLQPIKEMTVIKKVTESNSEKIGHLDFLLEDEVEFLNDIQLEEISNPSLPKSTTKEVSGPCESAPPVSIQYCPHANINITINYLQKN